MGRASECGGVREEALLPAHLHLYTPQLVSVPHPHPQEHPVQLTGSQDSPRDSCWGPLKIEQDSFKWGPRRASWPGLREGP